MTEKREFTWTCEAKREDAARTKAAALEMIAQERLESDEMVARLKALRLAQETHVES